MTSPEPRPHVIERALILAGAGHYRARWEIARALEKEGYTLAELSHLEGSSISRKLNALCRKSRVPKVAA
jgi:hypothetical protein